MQAPEQISQWLELCLAGSAAQPLCVNTYWDLDCLAAGIIILVDTREGHRGVIANMCSATWDLGGALK